MDSLLLVLTVIGVVLILAGIAKMRSNRRHHRDEIDHSILFDNQHNNDVLADDDVEIKRIRKAEKTADISPIHTDIDVSMADEDLPHISSDNDMRIDIDASERPEPIYEERPIARDRARTILNKLRMDNKGDDLDQEVESDNTLVKHYRTGAPDKVVVLNIMAPKGRFFAGPVLVDAIESLGMIYGEMEIFHLYSDNAPLFSLVNMVKPGIFDMTTIESLNTPGVSLFIQLPNKQGNGLEAFDIMLDVAQRLNLTLSGSLCDERRNILTHSAIDYMRQQLAEYDCKWLATA